MHRRSLLKFGALSAGAALARSTRAQHLVPDPSAVKRVLLVSKCHLDVGFTQTQQQVMQKYFQVYYPQAIRTAAQLRQSGTDRYTWITGSWLLYEYLEQASPADRRVMEQAIAAGDITWHALPFSWQTEMLTRSLITGSLGFSTTLDQRFGHKTISAKMTDVPGHTRGIIAPLSSGGIRLLDIGINAGSTPPVVPDVFVWKDAAGNSLAMLYHRHDYGSIVPIPGTDVAVDVEVRNDNSGPHTPEEIAGIYAKLRADFPAATITACSLNEVAAVVDTVRDQLPVVTGEIGDTWIYGVASDPPKVARFREATRLRQQWLDSGRFAVADSTDRQLLRRLLLAPEHTWGTDTKAYLDTNHYRPADLVKVLNEPGYQTMQHSWQEKRDDLVTAIATLPQPLQQEAQQRLQTLAPTRPSHSGLKPRSPAHQLDTAHFRLAFDPSTGAITRLEQRDTGRDWAGPHNPLALFTYQTLSAADFSSFLARYLKTTADWAPHDFGKPNISSFGAVSREWHPTLLAYSTAHTPTEDRVLLEWQIHDDAALATGNVAWPTTIFCELRLPADTPRLDLTVSTFGKVANRMPEAMWLTFNPVTRDQGTWSARKVEEAVLLTDVVEGGGRGMHAVEALHYREGSHTALEIQTLDAPLVAVAGRSPLNFTLAEPTLQDGLHFGLYNNAWGTNYPQWAGGDWQFRFSLAFPQHA